MDSEFMKQESKFNSSSLNGKWEILQKTIYNQAVVTLDHKEISLQEFRTTQPKCINKKLPI